MNASIYLHFDGRCEEAFGFYAEVLQGEVLALMRWAEMPGDAAPPGMEQKVMHAHLRVGSSDILGSDVPPGRFASPAGFGVALNVDSSDAVDGIVGALSEGGAVTMPPGQTFFAHRFATATDRYGIAWMIVHSRHTWALTVGPLCRKSERETAQRPIA